VRVEMPSLEPCTGCNRFPTTAENDVGEVLVWCPDPDCESPIGRGVTYDDAVADWNDRVMEVR